MSGSSARKFPSGGDYVDALQNTSLCFRDPELRGSRPVLDALRRPRPISGNFASVFSVASSNGQRYAVKCFTREVLDQELRYRAISEHLTRVDYPWKVGFNYLHDGVLVRGSWYPVLRMEWAEGTSLTRWVEQHLHDQVALTYVADRFAKLVVDLTAAGIAHGDLQHGNLLVATDGLLRLVDYDGMYVPALAGLPAAELGHRNYQLPTRSAKNFGSELDRFSAWVIYLSLIAVAAEPLLWSQLRPQDSEQLLLAEEDFKDPQSSSRFPVLLNHPVPGVRDVAQRIRAFLAAPIEALPELEPVTLGQNSPGSGATQGSTASPTATVGLPSWMAGHIAPTQPPEPVLFATRSVWLRVVSTLPLLVVALAGLLLFSGFVSLLAATATVAITIVVWLAIMFLHYRSRSEAQAVRVVRARHAELSRQLRKANLNSIEHARKLSALDQSAALHTTEHTKKERLLQEGYIRDVAAADRSVQQQLSSVDTQLQKLSGNEQRELRTLLSRLQAEHLHSRLSAVSVASAQLQGIGGALVGNLRQSGIRTAADFTGVVYSQGNSNYQSRLAHFVLPSGRRVRVPGIGEVKAGRLERWRDDHERRAQRSQPTSVPAARRQAVENQYVAQQQQLRADRKRIEVDAAQRKAVLSQRLAADRTQLVDELRRAKASAAQLRADHQRRSADAKTQYELAQQQTRAVTGELAACRRISYVRFLRFVMFGG